MPEHHSHTAVEVVDRLERTDYWWFARSVWQSGWEHTRLVSGRMVIGGAILLALCVDAALFLVKDEVPEVRDLILAAFIGSLVFLLILLLWNLTKAPVRLAKAQRMTAEIVIQREQALREELEQKAEAGQLRDALGSLYLEGDAIRMRILADVKFGLTSDVSWVPNVTKYDTWVKTAAFFIVDRFTDADAALFVGSAGLPIWEPPSEVTGSPPAYVFTTLEFLHYRLMRLEALIQSVGSG